MKSSPVIILDFGSQYTRLIARRVRGLGFYSEVLAGNTAAAKIKKTHPSALILSGGPESVYAAHAPQLDPEVFEWNLPILGICYGMCLLVRHLGGEIGQAGVAEYGPASLDIAKNSRSLLYKGLTGRMRVWMSHGDSIVKLPKEAIMTAWSREKARELIASFEHRKRKLYGVQYHPEVIHTENGEQLLDNFLRKIVGLKKNWSLPSFLKMTEMRIRKEVRGRSVVAAVSGGVDSTVMAAVLARVFRSDRKRLKLVLIDSGLLRLGEAKEVENFYRNELGLPLMVINAEHEFLSALKGVRNPEAKRHIIGRVFVEVFFKHVKPIEMLAQGTLYPDVIESISTGGPSHTIKTHHNRVPEILKLMEKGQVVEPFKDLFKDEVRELGVLLKLPRHLLERHPFPGPGLAVRILGAVTLKRLNTLRHADAILQTELRRAGLQEKTWQTFSVLLPVRSVGVAGDKRHYGHTLVIRSVTSRDGMTADFFVPSKAFLSRVSARITGEVKDITRVALDVSSKPPATIEWE